MNTDIITLSRCGHEDDMVLAFYQAGVGFAPEVGEVIFVANGPDEFKGMHMVTTHHYDGVATTVVFANRSWRWAAFHNVVDGNSITEHYATLL